MGGDFDKGGPGLGLRKAIENARQSRNKLIDDEASKLFRELNLLVQELSDEMKIIEKVSLAVSKGHSSVTIPFPNEWCERSVDTRLSGKITHSLVVENIVEKIKEENLDVLVIRNKIGGCCTEPTQYYSPINMHCSHCYREWYYLDSPRTRGVYYFKGERACCLNIRNVMKRDDGTAPSWANWRFGAVYVRQEELIEDDPLCTKCRKKYLPLSDFFVFDKLKLSKLNSLDDDEVIHFW